MQKGMEGCLSIPNELGDVYRNHTIFRQKRKKRKKR